MSTRSARITRQTNETDIALSLSLAPAAPHHEPSQSGQAKAPAGEKVVEAGIHSGVGFLDHMLDHIARHGQVELNLQAKGDTHIDDHHTVEDVGIVLGQAIDQALGDKRGIERYGSAEIPMDEALARVALDLSGRPALVYHVRFYGFDDGQTAVGGAIEGQSSGRFDVQLIREFFAALTNHAKMNLHIEVPWGENNHHIAEAIFKAFARALRQAVKITSDQVPSTKGSL